MLETTLDAPAADAIAKVGYTHDKMIDLIIANPRAKQDDLAALMGYTPGWVSRVVNSDSFKLRMAQRRAELIDPLIVASLEERFKALAIRGAEILQEKLDQPAAVVSFNDAAKALELGAKGLAVGGFGAKATETHLHVDLRSAIEEGQQRRQELRGRVIDMPRDFDLDTEFAPC